MLNRLTRYNLIFNIIRTPIEGDEEVDDIVVKTVSEKPFSEIAKIAESYIGKQNKANETIVSVKSVTQYSQVDVI